MDLRVNMRKKKGNWESFKEERVEYRGGKKEKVDLSFWKQNWNDELLLDVELKTKELGYKWEMGPLEWQRKNNSTRIRKETISLAFYIFS